MGHRHRRLAARADGAQKKLVRVIAKAEEASAGKGEGADHQDADQPNQHGDEDRGGAEQCLPPDDLIADV